ncbi:NfeD family protein [Halorubrum ruber]|uniref:NfeD family protein n=1 Tax=Halorubrum ruber TaxID=2982524 RepID=A0A8T8LJX4_9EURY|nr:NfeD family protein [Halorubrum ruber]QUO47459.1 NfeD family protein [Halorubrum ruber]
MNALAQSGLLSPDTLPLLLLTAGLLLSMAEALAPGANFIVVGIALIGAGLGGLLLSSVVAGAGLVAIMALLTLVFGAAAFYGYHEFDLYGGKGQQQTSDSDSLKGKTGTVTERVTPTGGEVKLAGGGFNPHYSARSMDGEIDEGEEVMVVDPGGGNVVTVESTGYVEDDIDRELAADRARKAAASDDDADETAPSEAKGGDAEPETDAEREPEFDRE